MSNISVPRAVDQTGHRSPAEIAADRESQAAAQRRRDLLAANQHIRRVAASAGKTKHAKRRILAAAKGAARGAIKHFSRETRSV